MNIRFLTPIAFLFLVNIAVSQNPAATALSETPGLATPSGIRLWPEGAPGAHGAAPSDIPTITPYLPDAGKSTGAALLVCPGGGYTTLSPSEGDAYARFFRTQGLACFVLTYRLGSNGYHYPEIFEDVQRAMRYLRAHAGDWSVDSHRIGIIGSSAGGHLASSLMTHFDSGKPDAEDPVERQNDRPDLGILCYPVIDLGPNTNKSSADNFLGPNPSPALIALFSNQLHVTAATPPAFVCAAWDDQPVKVENAISFGKGLREHGVPFDLHLYESGGHGFGLGAPWDQPEKMHPWVANCVYWLKLHKFVN